VTAAMLAGTVGLHVLLLPLVDPVKSFRPVGRVAEIVAHGAPIAYAGFGQGGNLLWALDRPRTQALPDGRALADALAPGAPRTVVVVEAGHWKAWQEEARRSDPRRARILDGARVAWEGRMKGRRLLVVTNVPTPASDAVRPP
jgi:hypothetical protein